VFVSLTPSQGNVNYKTTHCSW